VWDDDADDAAGTIEVKTTLVSAAVLTEWMTTLDHARITPVGERVAQPHG
jgi:hypothetical protein